MVRQTVSGAFLDNTFPLSGGAPGLMGQWFLGKVSKVERIYEIEIYDRADFGDMFLKPVVYTSFNSNESMLGITLGDLVIHGIDELDAYFVKSSSGTFCDMGFDLA